MPQNRVGGSVSPAHDNTTNWLPHPSYQVLATRSWLPDPGYQILATKSYHKIWYTSYLILATSYLILATSYQILATRSWLLDLE